MNTHLTSCPGLSPDFTGSLLQMGWSPFFQEHFEKIGGGKSAPARVVGVRKNSFFVSQGKHEWLATAAGRFSCRGDGLYPVAGDWVIVNDTAIIDILPRKNALHRGAAGSRGKLNSLATREQVLAANLDSVFVVCGLDRDFNLRRIERYLTLIYNCGLNPAIILTKADLHADPESYAVDVRAIAFGVPVYLVSAQNATGLTDLGDYLLQGRTIALIGSSGAGKSTLVNRLCGRQVQATKPVGRSTGKGAHTTTSRDLIMMPQGGMLIDNPGIREISFWENEDGTGFAFPEIEEFARQCRFTDCTHRNEPDCRVRQAVQEGAIAHERLENYYKMKRELMYLSDREHKSAGRVEKERWKGVATKVKAIKKNKFSKWL